MVCFKTHCIPYLRSYLPFINKPWGITLKQSFDVGFR